MTDRLDEVLTDLRAESDQLDSWVRDLAPDEWRRATPAAGWTIAHQIAHLHWTDTASIAAVDEAVKSAARDERALNATIEREAVKSAARDERALNAPIEHEAVKGAARDERALNATIEHAGPAFGTLMKQAASDPTGFVDTAAEQLAALDSDVLLTRWREGRAALSDALRGVPDDSKIAWFGPPMRPASMATARLMETWAHGHDVADALGLEVPVTARARHVCHLGVRTRGFAYAVRGLRLPDTPIRVCLTGPDGERWTWGPEDAPERVTGSAWDFALLATRRRHLADVDVRADGTDAEQWLAIIQAFAGPPGRDPVARASVGP